MRLKLAVRWLIPNTLDECANYIVLHGYWPEPDQVLSTYQSQRMKPETIDTTFDYLFEKYESLILARWPNIYNPTSIQAAKSFVLREWRKHGKPFGISQDMYLFHGLALVSTIPQNFGIPIDVPMTLDEVGRRAQAVLRDFRLFGVHIGADVIPEIVASINPNNASYFLLKEIRIHLERRLKEGKGVYQVVVDGGKCFTGKVNSGKNVVILPSASTMSS